MPPKKPLRRTATASGIGGRQASGPVASTGGLNLSPAPEPAAEPEAETPAILSDGVSQIRPRDVAYSKFVSDGKIKIRSNKFASEADQRRVIDMVCKYAYIGLIRKYDKTVGANIKTLDGKDKLDPAKFSQDNTYAKAALSSDTGQDAITEKHSKASEKNNPFSAAVSFYRFITQSFMFVDYEGSLTFDELHRAVQASPKFAFEENAVRTSHLYYPTNDSDGKIKVGKIEVPNGEVTDAIKSQYLSKMNTFIGASGNGNHFVLACMLEAGKKGRLKAYRSAMGKLLTFARQRYREVAKDQIANGRGMSGEDETPEDVEAYRKRKFLKEYIERAVRTDLTQNRSETFEKALSDLSAPSGVGPAEFEEAKKQSKVGDSVDSKSSVASIMRAVASNLSAYVGPSLLTRGKPSSMEAHAAHFKSKYKLTEKKFLDPELKGDAVIFGYIPVCDRNELLSYIFPTGKNMGTVRRKSTNEMYAEIRKNSQVLSVMQRGTTVAQAESVVSMEGLEGAAELFRDDAEERKNMLKRYSAAKKEYMASGKRSMPYWWAHVSGVQPSIKHRRDMQSSMKRYAEAVGDSIFPPSVMKSAMKHCLARHAFSRDGVKANASRGLPTMADGAVDTMQGISLQFIKELGRVVELYTAGDDKKRKTCATKSAVSVGKNLNLRRCTTTSVPTQPPAVGMAVMTLLCGSTVAYDVGELSKTAKKLSVRAQTFKEGLSRERAEGRQRLVAPKSVLSEAQSANKKELDAVMSRLKAENGVANRSESKRKARRQTLLKGIGTTVSEEFARMLISQGEYFLDKRAHDNRVAYEPCGMLTERFSKLLQHTDRANELLRIQKKDLTGNANVVDAVIRIANDQLKADVDLTIKGGEDMLPYIGFFYTKNNEKRMAPKRSTAKNAENSQRDYEYRPMKEADFDFKDMDASGTNAHALPRQDLKGTFFSIALIKRVMLKNTNVRLSNRAAMVVAVAITSLVETLMAVFYDGWDGAKRHKMYPADLVAGLLAGTADSGEGTQTASLADRLAIFALLKRLKCSLVTSSEDFTDIPQQYVRKFSNPTQGGVPRGKGGYGESDDEFEDGGDSGDETEDAGDSGD
tara:strand:- start:63 stop:3335 length:3273 start_codon:yes stop_codon:yes gene_type:complete